MNLLLIKNNRLIQSLLFDKQDEKLAKIIAKDQNADEYVWSDDSPILYSEYLNNEFVAPSDDYLIEIGILAAKIENETLAK